MNLVNKAELEQLLFNSKRQLDETHKTYKLGNQYNYYVGVIEKALKEIKNNLSVYELKDIYTNLEKINKLILNVVNTNKVEYILINDCPDKNKDINDQLLSTKDKLKQKKQEIEATKKELAKQIDDVKKLTINLESEKKEKTLLKAKLDETNVRVQQIDDELKQANEKIKQQEEEKKLVDAEIIQLRLENEKLQESKKTLDAEKVLILARLEKSNKQRDEIIASLKTKNSEILALKKENRILNEKTRGFEKRFKRQLNDFTRQIEEKKEETESLKQKINDIVHRALKQNNVKHEEEVQQLNQSIANNQAEISRIQEQLEDKIQLIEQKILIDKEFAERTNKAAYNIREFTVIIHEQKTEIEELERTLATKDEENKKLVQIQNSSNTQDLQKANELLEKGKAEIILLEQLLEAKQAENEAQFDELEKYNKVMEIFETMKKSTVNFKDILSELDKITTKLDDNDPLKRFYNSLKPIVSDRDAKIERLTNQLKTTNENFLEIGKEYDKKKEEIRSLTDSYDRLSASNDSRADAYEAEIILLQQQLEAKQAENTAQREELEQLKQNKNASIGINMTLEQKKKFVKDFFNEHPDEKEQLTQLFGNLISAEEQQIAKQKSDQIIQATKQLILSKQEQVDRLNAEIKMLSERKDELKKEVGKEYRREIRALAEFRSRLNKEREKQQKLNVMPEIQESEDQHIISDDRISSMEQALETKNNELKLLETDVLELKKEKSKLQEVIDALLLTNSNMYDEMTRLIDEPTKRPTTPSITETSVNKNGARWTDLMGRITKQISDLGYEIKQGKEIVDRIKKKIDTTQSDFNESRDEEQKLKTQNEQLQRSLAEILQKNEEFKKQAEINAKQFAELQELNNRLQIEGVRKTEEILQLSRENNSIELQLLDLKEKNAKIEELTLKLEQEQLELRNELDYKTDEMNTLKLNIEKRIADLAEESKGLSLRINKISDMVQMARQQIIGTKQTTDVLKNSEIEDILNKIVEKYNELNDNKQDDNVLEPQLEMYVIGEESGKIIENINKQQSDLEDKNKELTQTVEQLKELMENKGIVMRISDATELDETNLELKNRELISENESLQKFRKILDKITEERIQVIPIIQHKINFIETSVNSYRQLTKENSKLEALLKEKEEKILHIESEKQDILKSNSELTEKLTQQTKMLEQFGLIDNNEEGCQITELLKILDNLENSSTYINYYKDAGTIKEFTADDHTTFAYISQIIKYCVKPYKELLISMALDNIKRGDLSALLLNLLNHSCNSSGDTSSFRESLSLSPYGALFQAIVSILQRRMTDQVRLYRINLTLHKHCAHIPIYDFKHDEFYDLEGILQGYKTCDELKKIITFLYTCSGYFYNGKFESLDIDEVQTLRYIICIIFMCIDQSYNNNFAYRQFLHMRIKNKLGFIEYILIDYMKKEEGKKEEEIIESIFNHIFDINKMKKSTFLTKLNQILIAICHNILKKEFTPDSDENFYKKYEQEDIRRKQADETFIDDFISNNYPTFNNDQIDLLKFYIRPYLENMPEDLTNSILFTNDTETSKLKDYLDKIPRINKIIQEQQQLQQEQQQEQQQQQLQQQQQQPPGPITRFVNNNYPNVKQPKKGEIIEFIKKFLTEKKINKDKRASWLGQTGNINMLRVNINNEFKINHNTKPQTLQTRKYFGGLIVGGVVISEYWISITLVLCILCMLYIIYYLYTKKNTSYVCDKPRQIYDFSY